MDLTRSEYKALGLTLARAAFSSLAHIEYEKHADALAAVRGAIVTLQRAERALILGQLNDDAK